MPNRIQRKRKKGWRMPEGAVSVTRPGPWGNPFDTVEEFREALEIVVLRDAMPASMEFEKAKRMMKIAISIGELEGKDLACWCGPDKSCHADVLIEYANGRLGHSEG